MESENQTIPSVLITLAQLLGVTIADSRLTIPPKFGSGYCAGFNFNAQMRMLISNYELNEDIIIENSAINAKGKMIFFKFQNIFPRGTTPLTEKYVMETPSVLIGTSRINTDDFISVHSNRATINIEVDAAYLSNLFYPFHQSPVLQSLLQNTQPLLFEQMIYPSLQKIVDEMINEPIDRMFELFFLRIKAEELICRLLMELEKRDEQQLHALNTSDINAIYKVKEQMLEQLEIPPVIGILALRAGMSPSKLKRLFRQIFGDSIFSYYQQFRMKKAAFLLKEEKRSVSEVGYSLGFSNLSHFSRLFKVHIGMKPKQYAMLYANSTAP